MTDQIINSHELSIGFKNQRYKDDDVRNGRQLTAAGLNASIGSYTEPVAVRNEAARTTLTRSGGDHSTQYTLELHSPAPFTNPKAATLDLIPENTRQGTATRLDLELPKPINDIDTAKPRKAFIRAILKSFKVLQKIYTARQEAEGQTTEKPEAKVRLKPGMARVEEEDISAGQKLMKGRLAARKQQKSTSDKKVP